VKIEVFFQHGIASNVTECYIIRTNYNGKKELCKPMEMVFEPLNEQIKQDPSLSIGGLDVHMGFFQALVDGLARVGYRYESSDTGELKATKVHLEDMRKLVFSREGMAEK
jgi:hypothetical protein